MRHLRILGILTFVAAIGCSSSSTTGVTQAPPGPSVDPESQQPAASTPTKTEPKPKTTVVKGKVMLNGQPLAGVMVFFHSDDGLTSGTETTADGSYDLPFVNPGKNKITIGYNEDDAKSKTNKKVILIPEKYSKTETSGLSFDLIAGPNTVDLELISK